MVCFPGDQAGSPPSHPPVALLPVSLPGVAISLFLTLLPRYHATAELNLLFCLTFSIPRDAFPSSRVGTQRRAGILQANGRKPGRAARASLRGTSSAMQMHPPVKEEAEIYAPMQKHMLLIRGWHSHTRFQHFQDTVLALHSCFSISDL